MHGIPETGFLRLTQIIGDTKAGIPAIIPVSKSTWWAGVRSGRYPKPTRALGRRITAWNSADIRALIEQAQSEGRACLPLEEQRLAEGQGDER